MKHFVILLFVIVAVYGVTKELQELAKEHFAGVTASCASEVGANEADIADLDSWKKPSTQEGKCLRFCFLQKFKMIDADGKVHKEGTIASLEPLRNDDPEMFAKIIEIPDTCGPEISNTPLTDLCDIGSEILACGMREAKSVGIEDPFRLVWQ